MNTRAHFQLLMGLDGSGPPPGGIAFVSSPSGQYFGSASTTHLKTMPVLVSSGDLLLVYANTQGATVVTPSGFTVSSTSFDSGSSIRSYIYTKIADGTEGGATVDFSTASAQTLNTVLVHISGAASTSYYEDSSKFYASIKTITPDALTPSWGALNTAWVVISSNYYGNTVTQYPLPDNQYQSNELYQGITISTKIENTTTKSPESLMFSVNDYGSLFTIAIKPL